MHVRESKDKTAELIKRFQMVLDRSDKLKKLPGDTADLVG